MKCIVRTIIFCFLFVKTVKGQSVPFKGADWITVSYAEQKVKRPVALFTKNFKAGKPLKKATLCITALGLYEAQVNHKRVGDAYFTPGFTNYRNRLHYQTYDVTKLLAKQNTISVFVDEGWYRGTFRNLESDTQNNNYGKESGLLAVLRINYSDGTEAMIKTDSTWNCTQSQLRYSELYDGEYQNSLFAPAAAQPVSILKSPVVELLPSSLPPVTKHETFTAKSVKEIGGKYLIDFGQNLAGWVQLRIQGQPGDSLIIEHAEMLENGDLFLANLRSAKATDIYVLNGKPQILEPHFTYHGFRYARLSYYRNGELITLPSGWSAKAVALYSDLKETGSFSCSDPMINKLQSNIEWSLKSNFVDIPTDCPQRSERLAWTADAQVFCATASFLRDTKSFYESWLPDLAAEQGSNGAVPNFIPTSSPFKENVYGVTGWGDAATIMPWTLYQIYGDKKILERQYDSMKGWVDYMTSVSVNGLFQNKGYGDWYAMGQETDIRLIDQCFYAASTAILINTAILLDKKDDVKRYKDLLINVKRVFNDTFNFNTPATATQTAYVLALQFDLLPEEQRATAADSLVSLIKQNGSKLATGFLGTPYILPVLSRFGHSDVAYELLLQKDCPSWLYPITKGATTIWERWDAVRPDGTLQATSFNHYAYGAVGQWLYEHVAGIRATSPGYKTFLIAPETNGSLTWAKASYESAYGTISSSWRKKTSGIVFDIVVPDHTNAVFRHGKTVKNLSPGTYHFRLAELP